LKQNLVQPGRFAAAAAMGTTPRLPCTERLNLVRVPTLVIMGTKDPDFDPLTEGKFIAQQTGGRLEMIEGAGHYPQTEMPEVTAPLVLGFLKRLT
jgi:pimeloyl-ACP methyl ester carboxylesterase